MSPIKTTAEDKSDGGAKKQSEDSSDQVQQQQMYQQAFLQNAVAQNMQVSQFMSRPLVKALSTIAFYGNYRT